MSLRSRSTQPAGRQAFTLSVWPHVRGATVRLTVTVTGPREDKADYQAFWRKELKAWLSALADVADGRRPWPEAGIPAPLRQACAACRPWPRAGHVDRGTDQYVPGRRVAGPPRAGHPRRSPSEVHRDLRRPGPRHPAATGG